MWMHLLLKETSIRVKKLQHTSSSATGRPDTPLPPSPERVMVHWKILELFMCIGRY